MFSLFLVRSIQKHYMLSIMQLIKDEEALSPLLPSLASCYSLCRLPPISFPKLSSEIRDIIYQYALIRPSTGPTVIPTHICYIHPKASISSSAAFGGTETCTHLFRVNRQVSSEALETCYSTFPFHFPPPVDTALVNATLRDTLSTQPQSLISNIGFMIFLRTTPRPFTHSDEETQ